MKTSCYSYFSAIIIRPIVVYLRGTFILLAVGPAVVGQHAAVHAAPLSFRFAASISQVQGDPASINLPFSLQLGEQISAVYTFQTEQDLLGIYSGQGFITRGLVALTIEGFAAQGVINFGTLNDGGPVDINNPPPYRPKSSFSLGYISHTDVMPGWGGFFQNHPMAVGLSLAGPEGIISGPNDVLSVGVWNQLTTLRQLDISIGYPTTVSVRASVGSVSVATGPAPAGDFNSDGRIDASDYVAWRHNNGSAADYKLWREHFGQSLTGTGASLDIASVPEASSLARLVFAAFMLLPTRRRKPVPHNRV